MKKYESPKLQWIDLRPEERIADSSGCGNCESEAKKWALYYAQMEDYGVRISWC